MEVHETRSRVHAAAQEEGKLASKKQKSENEDQERGQHVPSKNKKSADNKGQDGEAEAPTKSKKLKADESEPNVSWSGARIPGGAEPLTYAATRSAHEDALGAITASGCFGN